KATPTDLDEAAWDALRRLNNLDIDWMRGEPRKGTPAAKLEELGSPVIPLLRGLDSPRKFGAADVLLERKTWGPVGWAPDGVVAGFNRSAWYGSVYNVRLDIDPSKGDPNAFPIKLPWSDDEHRGRVNPDQRSEKAWYLHERYDRTL